MTNTVCSTSIVFVASDSANEADLVEKLLRDEYENVFIHTDPEGAAREFDQLKPDVLVLAFNGLERLERFYLGLFRLSEVIHQQPHRTVILCHKDEVKAAYALCRKGLFDDYVLFWPLPQDSPRLLMAVRHALRDLAVLRIDDACGPTVADFASEARRLANLEAVLGRQMELGGKHIEEIRKAIAQTEQDVGASLDRLSQQLFQGFGTKLDGEAGNELEDEIHQLKSEEIRDDFRVADESIEPLSQWVDGLKHECDPHLKSIRTMSTMVDQVRPVVLVVDDDVFQHKIVKKILEAENYHVLCAVGGIEALAMMHQRLPDVILMDFVMPEMNGVEVIRKLKAVPKFAAIPIIMITGKGEKAVVTEAITAGAIDFVVKPYNREKLTTKVSRVLAGKEGDL